LVRTIAQNKPTLIIDEFDCLNGNEELRAVLNAGHRRRGAYRGINVPDGDDGWRPVRLPVFGAKVIGLIGDLPETLEDRSILINILRRTKDELIEHMPIEDAEEHLRPVRETFQRWADRHAREFAGKLDPKIEIGGALDDRALDNWRPLFAIAEHLDGDWLDRAQTAWKSL
jgi:putative DNA primase/helicase